MKNILVPTDFSECSKNAAQLAYHLAKRSGAKLHLVTSIGYPRHWAEQPLDKKERKTEALQAEASLLEMKQGFEGVEVATSCMDKHLLNDLADYVKQHGIDLLVIGSHGASGKNEIIIGSNTQKIVRQVHCPVLVVKNPVKNPEFPRVVYASSFDKEELPSFLFFKDLIKHFTPEVHLVSVHATPFGPPPHQRREAMKPFREACKPLVSKAHVFRALSIDDGIRSFSENIGADLIVVSNHERHPLKRMLIGSNVEALVNHSSLPVLTIDFE